MGVSYKDAGVDITAGNRAVDLMKGDVKRTFRPEVLTDLGNFAGLFALNSKKYHEPVLVAGTDGVGTKLKIAMLMDQHDTIGIDAVAMCVNDILVQGAEPLFFLDYIAVGQLNPEKVADIVHGVAEGCLQAACSLIGGETAEMPGFYGVDEYDIAGFAVGVVEKSKVLTGANIKPGDVIMAIPSSGLHSNGFSLARKVLLEIGGFPMDAYLDEIGMTVGEAMLKPTRIYVKDVLPLIEKELLKGMAHITGGGLLENIPRVFPDGISAEIDASTWEIPAIFRLIERVGDVKRAEMYRVFNMGVGMALIVDPANVEKVKAMLPETFVIGHTIEGCGEVIIK